jgi:hypothetical protein
VQVGADQTHYDLVKDADELWTGTTRPLVPGFHYYYFFVDGVQVNDSASHTFLPMSFVGARLGQSRPDLMRAKNPLLSSFGRITRSETTPVERAVVVPKRRRIDLVRHEFSDNGCETLGLIGSAACTSPQETANAQGGTFDKPV